MRALSLLSLLLACSPKPTPEPTPKSPVVSEPELPEPESPAPPPERPKPKPTHTLQLRQPIQLDPSTTLTANDVIIETIEPSPDGSYPSGGADEVSLLLLRNGTEHRASLLDITEGYTPRMVAWLEPYRVALVAIEEMHGTPKIAVVIETVGEARTDAPPQKLRIEKDQTIAFDDGHRLTFTGHGHKRVGPDQTSPLMVYTRWELPGVDPVDDSQNLQTGAGEKSWRFRDFELTLLDWQYDRWMDLEIHQLQRRRVTSP